MSQDADEDHQKETEPCGEIDPDTKAEPRGGDGPDAKTELLIALVTVASVALVCVTEVCSVPFVGLFSYLVAVLGGFVLLASFEGSPYGCMGTLFGLLGTLHFLFRENNHLFAYMGSGCFFSLFLAVAIVLRHALRGMRWLVLRIVGLLRRP